MRDPSGELLVGARNLISTSCASVNFNSVNTTRRAHDLGTIDMRHLRKGGFK